MSYIIQCDRCSVQGGPVEQAQLPSGWTGVGINIKVAGGTRYKWHQFCLHCTQHLDIKPDLFVEETSAEKLVTILESMVGEAVEERG